MDSSLETYITSVGDFEIKPPFTWEIYRGTQSICTNNTLEMGLMYL